MILAVLEHRGSEPDRPSLETLAFARRLAGRMDVPVHALVLGRPAVVAVRALAGSGVARVHGADDDRLHAYAPEALAACVVELVGAIGPEVVVAPGTDRGHEVLAHVAARMGLPMAANCTEVDPTGAFAVTRYRWGGSVLEEATVEGVVKLLTVAPQAVPAEAVGSDAEPSVEPFAPDLAEELFRVRVTGRIDAPADRVSLAEARLVIGGGRGVGGAEGFGVLEELARLLGGAVGCSRAVTGAGWRPHAEQIGQTGTRIAPELYIACGISGATQHLVGCKGAKRLLAINTDPDAPIVKRADYAVIGDLHAVVPALIEAIAAER